MTKGRILIVDDDPEQLELLSAILSSTACEIQTVDSTSAATQALASARFHAAVCDLVMPSGGGAEILHFARGHGIQTPIIILTGYADAHIAEVCSGLGAFDFVAKPVDRLSLIAVLRRALLRSGLLFEEIPRSAPRVRPPALAYLVGASQPMAEVFAQIAKVAEASANVCIYGESGTGKELVAQAIHSLGPRRDRPLVVLDCASIPEGLIESELFGHVRGAFTTALADHAGLFELADGGTLFLDEVGELSLPLQAKLLRVIQCREFRKVGGNRSIKVDVRIIAATNKDLRAQVAAGKFREDLLFRLEVVPISLPPLRERKEDIPLLVEHLITKFNRTSRRQIRGVSGRTMGVLLRYSWPGNIRELENVIEQAAVMSEGDILEIADIASLFRSHGWNGLAEEVSPWPCSLKEAERDLILKTLQNVQGNRTRAAELLGISLRGLHYKLREFQRERMTRNRDAPDSDARRTALGSGGESPQPPAGRPRSSVPDRHPVPGNPRTAIQPAAPGA
jgi:DNA-binding NtrC family response regulator